MECNTTNCTNEGCIKIEGDVYCGDCSQEIEALNETK